MSQYEMKKFVEEKNKESLIDTEKSFAQNSVIVHKKTWLQSFRQICGYVLCCGPIMGEFTVPDYHVGVVTEFGHFTKSLNPGTYTLNPATEFVKLVPLKRIPDLHHGMVCRNGQFVRIEKPGLAFANPFLDETLTIVEDVQIDELHHGFLCRNGKFVKILNPGIHIVNEFLGETIEIIKDVVIADTHHGLFCVYGVFKRLLSPGIHVYNKLLGEEIKVVKDCVIKEGFVGVRKVNGVTDQKQDILGPGAYVVNPMCQEEIEEVDMRIVTKELKPQELQSKNTVSITVWSILVYQITNAYKAHCIVDNIDFTLRETIKAITHQVLSEHDLDEITAHKVRLSQDIMNRVSKVAQEWGVHILNVAIKDIVYAKDIKDALSAAAVAQRTSEATLIAAKAEVEASKYRRQAAENFNSATGLQYIYMEQLKRLAESTHHSKIYFLPASFGNCTATESLSNELNAANKNKNNDAQCLNSINDVLKMEQCDLLSDRIVANA